MVEPLLYLNPALTSFCKEFLRYLPLAIPSADGSQIVCCGAPGHHFNFPRVSPSSTDLPMFHPLKRKII